MSPEDQKQTIKEAMILEALKHPNIISFKEVYFSKQSLSIVMEYANGGDLAQVINQYKSRNQLIPEQQILDWFTQLCLAIKHVHDRKIIHRDLKTANVFMTSQGIVKLGDFGIARILQTTRENAKTLLGTPFYLSPEIVESKPYSFSSDIWSLGIILYELCTLTPPFTGDSILFLALKIVQGQYQDIPKSYSNELRELVREIIVVDPCKRVTVDQIFKKPVIIRRVSQFLDEKTKQQEFSHTILHQQNLMNPSQINLQQIPTESQIFSSIPQQRQQISQKQALVQNQVNQLQQDATARDFQFNKYIREQQKEKNRAQQYPDYLQHPIEQQQQKLPVKKKLTKEQEEELYKQQLKKQREEYYHDKQKILEKQKSQGEAQKIKLVEKEQVKEQYKRIESQQSSAKKKQIEQQQQQLKQKQKINQQKSQNQAIAKGGAKKIGKQQQKPVVAVDPQKKELEKQKKKESIQKQQQDLKQFLQKQRQEKKIKDEVQIEWIGSAKLSLQEEQKLDEVKFIKAKSEQEQPSEEIKLQPELPLIVQEKNESENIMNELKSIVLYPESQPTAASLEIDEINSIDSLERDDED